MKMKVKFSRVDNLMDEVRVALLRSETGENLFSCVAFLIY